MCSLCDIENEDREPFCKRCKATEASECICADEIYQRQKDDRLTEIHDEVKQWTF
jgi:hypothetical protein